MPSRLESSSNGSKEGSAPRCAETPDELSRPDPGLSPEEIPREIDWLARPME